MNGEPTKIYKRQAVQKSLSQIPELEINYLGIAEN